MCAKIEERVVCVLLNEIVRMHDFISVGAWGFEPQTSRTRTVHSSQAELRPERVELYRD